VCTATLDVDEEGETIVVYGDIDHLIYDGRVCQFNFPVTTPYVIQKGASLSSVADDIDKL